MEGGGESLCVFFFFCLFLALPEDRDFVGKKCVLGQKVMAYCQTHSDYEASKNAFKVGSVKF